MTKQTHEIRFRCTLEEHERVKRNADLSNLNIKQFLLHLGMNTKLKLVRE